MNNSKHLVAKEWSQPQYKQYTKLIDIPCMSAFASSLAKNQRSFCVFIHTVGANMNFVAFKHATIG